MRTEDDLRTALTALERHAPAAARVLPGSGRKASRGLRSPHTTRWLAGIATAAALAGAITALILPGGVSSPSGATNVTTLVAKFQAAISGTSGIVYETGWTTNTGKAPIVQESWYYPGQPAAGQQFRTRGLAYSTDGKLHLDVGDTYLMPAPSSQNHGRPVPVQDERISVDYVTKTWYQLNALQYVDGPAPSPAEIIKDAPTERWTVSHTTLDGRAALELTEKDTVGDNSSDASLWFDASTYLPLREVTSFGPKSERTSLTLNYQYLPATSANLAKLTPPIPAGFRQVAASGALQGLGPSRQVKLSPNPHVTQTLAPGPTASR